MTVGPTGLWRPLSGVVALRVLLVMAGLAMVSPAMVSPAMAEPSHGIALFDDLKYPADFEHFEYVNPDAPKGGIVRVEGFGSFDTLHDFTLKGRAASGSTLGWQLTFDQFMVKSEDEPDSWYGLLAESAEIAEDNSWIEMRIRPEARWNDGMPVTADDAIFTFNIIKQDGKPLLKQDYSRIVSVTKTGSLSVRYDFSGPDRDLAFIVARMTVLPKHYWETRDFSKTTMDPPLGSGPYRVTRVDPGRSVVYSRVEDYWGGDIPVNIGRHNFDQIRIEYFRDLHIAREAFRANVTDYRGEGVAKFWAIGYDGKNKDDGWIIRNLFPVERPASVRNIVFNTRLEKFKDIRVREAISLAFEFEWKNRVLFYYVYERGRSFFQRSDLEHKGLPSAAELLLLEPFRNQLPPRVFTEPYTPPENAGIGIAREPLLRAAELMEEAGWILNEDGLRVHWETGEPFSIEFLLGVPADEKGVVTMFPELIKIGIPSRVRTVDVAQFQQRVGNFDFDMRFRQYTASLTPGTELRDWFGSRAADTPFSRNSPGIKNPAVDALIDHALAATNREELLTAIHALDRVLLWNHYMITGYLSPGDRIVYWNRFGLPDPGSRFRSGFPDLWWVDPELDAALQAR